MEGKITSKLTSIVFNATVLTLLPLKNKVHGVPVVMLAVAWIQSLEAANGLLESQEHLPDQEPGSSAS